MDHLWFGRRRGTSACATREFSERGPCFPAPCPEHVDKLSKTDCRKARRVIKRQTPETLAREYTVQGFHVNGLYVVSTVYQHFSHHAGQIIYLTKLKHGKDMRFTELPVIKKPTVRRSNEGTRSAGFPTAVLSGAERQTADKMASCPLSAKNSKRMC